MTGRLTKGFPRILAVAFGVCGLTSCSTVRVEKAPARMVPAIVEANDVLQSAIEEELIPGAVLLVGLDGEVIHQEAFGHAQRYDYGGIPLPGPPEMTAEHVFDLASLTKVFATTLGVMLLVDRGEVELDAPVRTYLPSFTGLHKDSVTVRHLLTHSAGLYQWKPTYYHADNQEDVLAYISELELAWPVGRERHYSDLGFMLLGYIIESASGRRLDVFLEEEFYRPLGLQKTGFLPQQRRFTPFAATSHGNPFERKMVADDDFGYLIDENVDDFTGWREYTVIGEVNDGNAFYVHGGVAGHAGLFSTAAELNVLLNLLLDKGVHDGERYLSEEVVDEFLTPTEFGHGLGWAMSPEVLRVGNLPHGAFGHTGFTGTYAMAVPEYGLTVILLTNRQNLGVDEGGSYNSVNPLQGRVAKILVDAARSGGETL